MFALISPTSARQKRSPVGILLYALSTLLVAGVLVVTEVSLSVAPAEIDTQPLRTRAVAEVVAHPITAVVPAVPVVVPVVASELATETVTAAAPTSWSIGITAVGLQSALDQCQWVRMDFSAAVALPVVAAHNYCGGDIVLSMAVGEIVTIAGTGLDGTYVVTGSRDAWSNAPAAEAIAGMSGDVILQTCYWVNDGSERLVSLQRV